MELLLIWEGSHNAGCMTGHSLPGYHADHGGTVLVPTFIQSSQLGTQAWLCGVVISVMSLNNMSMAIDLQSGDWRKKHRLVGHQLGPGPAACIIGGVILERANHPIPTPLSSVSNPFRGTHSTEATRPAFAFGSGAGLNDRRLRAAQDLPGAIRVGG
jgi:hypothetical protein